MTDNVIIFGAGASYDAGIPLMSGFVEKMWEFAIRGKNNGKTLSSEDSEIFHKAIEVKNELDSYHGRATFDDRNIEDILSILSFNIIGGKTSDRNKLKWILKAITRTIELSCKVEHDGKFNRIQESPDSLPYQTFWYNFFNISKNREKPPTIISFNYDLVMERALIQSLVNIKYNSYKDQFPYDGFRLNYYYGEKEVVAYRVEYTEYDFRSERVIKSRDGSTIEEGEGENPINIELLKLHGSLNFSRQMGKQAEEKVSLTHAVADPFILPPIFNKLSSSLANKMWKIALERLRQAKNVIIVGYSLPQTDIYMQYFLKSALGPNLNLNKIFVFDPVLFNDGPLSEAMRERYACCFSPQLQNRIIFRPEVPKKLSDTVCYKGTFNHFVHSMVFYDKLIFF